MIGYQLITSVPNNLNNFNFHNNCDVPTALFSLLRKKNNSKKQVKNRKVRWDFFDWERRGAPQKTGFIC